MNKSVLISIQPKWCELIASGKKTIEVRKTAPKLETPFKCYIYCTASDVHSCLMVGGGTKLIQCCNYKIAIPVGGVIGNGKVFGEFVCDNIDRIPFEFIQDAYNGDFCGWHDLDLDRMHLHPDDFYEYAKGNNLYGWHISDLKIYDKPKELGEFKTTNKAIIARTFNLEYGKPLSRPPQSWCYIEELKA